MPFALVGASPYVTRDFLVQAKFIYLSPAAHFSPAASLPGFSGYGRGLFQSGGWGGGGVAVAILAASLYYSSWEESTFS